MKVTQLQGKKITIGYDRSAETYSKACKYWAGLEHETMNQSRRKNKQQPTKSIQQDTTGKE